jgi:hypothetical protein
MIVKPANSANKGVTVRPMRENFRTIVPAQPLPQSSRH